MKRGGWMTWLIAQLALTACGQSQTRAPAMAGSACDANDEVPPAGMCLPACSGDDECGNAIAGRLDASNPPDAGEVMDAFKSPDAGEVMDGGICDCTYPEVVLDCVCSMQTCPDFESAKTFAPCPAPDGSTLETGCGMALVSTGSGFDLRAFGYTGTEHTLAQASTALDAPFGPCGRWVYSTGLPVLSDCADYTICSLCPGGKLQPCP